MSLQITSNHAMHLALGSVEELVHLSKMREPYSPVFDTALRLKEPGSLMASVLHQVKCLSWSNNR